MSNISEKVETKAAEEETEAAEADVCCANCGAAEVDNIKLEDCDDCDLVKYCGEKCREEHREQHDEECKNRKALLHDRKLFEQPERTHRGECPICFLQMPIDLGTSGFYSCCSTWICLGCVHANYNNIKNDHRCAFCRTVVSKEKNEIRQQLMIRVKANDPVALCRMAGKCYDEGDYDAAFEYFTKAAELGHSKAHFKLGMMYRNGRGVEKDEEKVVYHWEKAAIGGHPEARHNLACIEEENGNIERAVKHFVIAAKLGLKESMKVLWAMFKDGCIISKEELDATLRTHHAAIDATKSPQRKIAEELFRELLQK